MSEDLNNLSEQDLVLYCVRQQRKYQEFLYHRYADEMYSVALIYCDSDQDACDILQESFIKVFKTIIEKRKENWKMYNVICRQ